MFESKSSLATNFLDHAPSPTQLRRQTWLIAAVFSVIVGSLSAFGAYASYHSTQRGTSLFNEVTRAPLIGDLRRLLGDPNAPTETQPQAKEQINILLLGIGGEGHEGGQLTDTIILASVDLKEKRVAMLSIPRDTAYPLGEGRFEKINAVHAYAEQDHPGEGPQRTAEAFSKLLEVDIDHVVRIDFSGFVKLINAVDGVDINVERSFTDPQYPTPDKKWMSVSFKKGMQHMNGEQALIYARSRHGNNGEGSDFARSYRQQQVILAVREKLLSLNTLTDTDKLSKIYTIVRGHLSTDLSLWDMLKFAPMASDFSKDHVSLRVLTDAPGGELSPATVAGAYMLFPKQPDWSEIRAIAQHPFTEEPKTIADEPTPSAKPQEKRIIASIEVKNGTTRTGFASQVAAKLEQLGYEVGAFGNAQRRGYERTMIYDLTNGQKSAELAKLKQLLAADSTSVELIADSDDGKRLSIPFNDNLPPERLSSANTDFLVILGEASYAFVKPASASNTSTSTYARN